MRLHCDILKVRMYVLVLIVKYCMTQHREDESTLHDETDDISANPISALAACSLRWPLLVSCPDRETD